MGCLLTRLFVVVLLCRSMGASGAHPFEILKRDGTLTSNVVLQELDPEQIRFRADRNNHELSRSSIVEFRTADETIPQLNGNATLRLVNGDILTGNLTSLGDSGIDWLLFPDDRRAAVRLTVPLEYVLGISFGSSLNDSLKTLLPRVAQTGTDKLRLSNGDELTGDLSALSLEQLTLETETGTTGIPLKTVQTILFNEELTETPPRSPDRTLIMLEPGTRLTLSNFQISKDSIFRGETVSGELLELSLNRLRAAVLLDSSIQPLSEREPKSVLYQPFLSTIPPVRKNSGVHGGPLQIGQRPYLTGLGMQSRTEITWSLDSSDQFLISDIGLDAEVKQRGSLRFRILVDGQEEFESPEMKGGDPPRSILIDLRERRTLTLIADFGKDADVQDLAVWGNALILSRPSTP